MLYGGHRHQVQNASFNVEYAYVATNALGSFSGRGGVHSDFSLNKEQIPNTFKEAMTLPQAALTMKEAVFYNNMMLELGLKEGCDSVPLNIDNTSALHVVGNRTYSHRTKQIALRYFFVQELVEEGEIIIHFVKTQDQIADLGTKHVNKPRHRALIKLIREFEA